MDKIPTIEQNPDGLHAKYNVERVDGKHIPGAEYFVLRLDAGADTAHRKACLHAMLTYARHISNDNLKLSQDIMKRYSKQKRALEVFEKYCPNLAKLMGVEKQKEWLTNFLAHMKSKNVVLAKLNQNTGRYLEIGKPIDLVLAEYLDLDLQAIDEERKSLLKNNEHVGL